MYILLRLGEQYLKVGNFVAAKATYLETCKASASAHTWLGVGVACRQMGDYHEALEAFAVCSSRVILLTDFIDRKQTFKIIVILLFGGTLP